MKKAILHTCCGPCAGGVLKAFKEKFDEVLLFFSNSNLNSREEYNKRLFEVKKLAKKEGIKLIEDDYNHSDWLRYIKKLNRENQPSQIETEAEGGERCRRCFEYRLARTAELAKKKGFSFSTTLAVSPYKNELVLNEEAKEVEAEGSLFIPLDKIGNKKEIWKESFKIYRELDMYRQKYCGCEFSIKNTD